MIVTLKPGPTIITPKKQRANPIIKSKANAPIVAAGSISKGKTTFFTKLGCETIVEDYVTSQKLKNITKLTINLSTYALMILVSLSIFLLVAA